MEILGTIKKLGEVQTFASGFTKRDVVILTQEQYPQLILVEFLKDKADIFGDYKEGDSVKVGINLRGRQYQPPQGGEEKYFNSIVGWRIEKVVEGSTPSQAAPAPVNDDPFADDEDASDLPF